MTEKNKQASTRPLPENIETPEVPDDEEIEEVTDEQLERVKQGLLNTIVSTDMNEHQMIVGKDYYLLLKKMEDYAQDLAELAVRYFKEKDLDARKDLILKSVEVLKLNPPPGPGSAINHQAAKP